MALAPEKRPLSKAVPIRRRGEEVEVQAVQYAIEFKQEAVRLVESGQTIAAAAHTLGVVPQTLGNRVQEQHAGKLKGATTKPR